MQSSPPVREPTPDSAPCPERPSATPRPELAPTPTPSAPRSSGAPPVGLRGLARPPGADLGGHRCPSALGQRALSSCRPHRVSVEDAPLRPRSGNASGGPRPPRPRPAAAARPRASGRRGCGGCPRRGRPRRRAPSSAGAGPAEHRSRIRSAAPPLPFPNCLCEGLRMIPKMTETPRMEDHDQSPSLGPVRSRDLDLSRAEARLGREKSRKPRYRHGGKLQM
mmetsp:Transcript_10417/g.26988  ORF Transcript_10417/g.26988 Transcript_10417/m.26988 type:complete len:222 (-) Transcript_10417:207-872(-)